MKLKPKTIRRLTLAGVVAVLAIGVAVVLLFVRTAQSRAIAERLRTEGMTAHESGDNFEALSALGRYLRREPEDADALLAYAESRQEIEEADGRHITESIGVLQRYLVLKPDDREAKLDLLRLYNRAGYYPEARQAAQELRPGSVSDATEEHLEVLRQEAIALLGLARHVELEHVLSRAAAIDPTDMETWLLRVELWAREGDLSGMLEEAAALEDRGVAPEKARLMRALVLLRRENPEDMLKAEALLREIADSGAEFEGSEARVLAVALDRVGRHDAALDVVRDAAAKGDEDARLLVARRLYQRGHVDELETMLSDVEAGDPSSHGLLAGLKGLIAIERGRTEQAIKIQDDLASREADFRAEAWSIVLEQAIGRERINAPDRITALREAAEADPHESIIRALLAEALAAAGRHAAAAETWREVVESPGSVGWAGARARLAEALLHTGEIPAAVEAAVSARLASPNNVLANVVLLEAEAEALAAGSSRRDAEALAAFADRVWEALAERESADADRLRTRAAAARIAVLARLGREDEARQAIRNLGDRPDVVTPSLVERLTLVNEGEGLGALAQISSLGSELERTSAAVVLARALEVARESDVEEGLDLIDEKALRDRGSPERWAVTRARYLSRVGDERALGMWRSAADAHPDSVLVQRAVLLSRTAGRDRELIERAIDRYLSATGAAEGEDAIVELARARAMLASMDGAKELEEVIALLRRMVAERPGLLDGRTLLASALIRRAREGEKGREASLAGAREQLSAALAIAPGSASLALELARVHRMLGESEEAIAQLRSVMDNSRATEAELVEAARLLRREGDAETAARGLASWMEEGANGTGPEVLLALGESALAAGEGKLLEGAVEALLRAELATAEAVVRAASLAAAAREEATAKDVLSRLEAMGLSEADRLVWRARFVEATGDRAGAIAAYEAALEARAGEDAATGLASLLVLSGDDDRARELAGAWVDRSEAMARLEPVVAALGREDLPSDVGRLLRLASGAVLHGGAEGIAERLVEGTERGVLDDADWLRSFVDQFADVRGVQSFTARRLAAADGGAFADEALAMAQRAMEQSPTEVESARLAAELLLREGRWQEMLAAARAWRSRASGRKSQQEADVAIAQARLNLGESEKAVRRLMPWARAMDASEIDGIDLAALNVLGTALCASGSSGEAESLLEPLVDGSRGVRLRVWLPLAAGVVPDPARARAWIDRAAGLVEDRTGPEQLAIATAYAALAARSPEPVRDELVDVVEQAAVPVKNGDLAAAAHETVGKIRHLVGDEARAEAAYREALAIDRDRTDALNNLATILSDRPPEVEEAVSLARRAVELTEESNADYLETLATALERLGTERESRGDTAGAELAREESLQALERLTAIAPERVGALWRLARGAERAGRLSLAMEAYGAVIGAPGAGSGMVAAASNNLSYLLLSEQEDAASHQEAYLLAQRAVALEANASFLDTLGHACVATGRLDEAVATFERVLEREPGKVSSLLGLARAVFESGATDTTRAQEALELVGRAAMSGEGLSPRQTREYETLRALLESR